MYKTDHSLGENIYYTGQLREMLPNEAISGVDRNTESSTAQFVQHGRGKQSWSDGSKYEGDWRNGMAHGIGLI